MTFAKPDKLLDLVCLGEAMVEFDERSAGEWHQGIGGDTFNVAVAAKAAGASVAYATALGTDSWGDAILGFCDASGINVDAVTRNPALDTGLYFVRHDREGHNFAYRRKNSAATRYEPSANLDEMIGKSRILHYSGISLAIADKGANLFPHAVEVARSRRTAISFDINYRPALWEPSVAQDAILNAMRESDILLPGMEDLSKLFGIRDIETAAEFCLRHGPRVLAIKNGSEDILVVEGERLHRVTPPRVDARDANGAGDCFDGTFLAALAAGARPHQAAISAAEAAAASTLRNGAIGVA